MTRQSYTANPGKDGEKFATDKVDGVNFAQMKLAYGSQGVARDVTGASPFPAADPKVAGKWGYLSGNNGKAVVPEGARVLQITAIASTGNGHFRINGGDIVLLPHNSALTIEPKGNLVGPTIDFLSDAYFIEYVV